MNQAVTVKDTVVTSYEQFSQALSQSLSKSFSTTTILLIGLGITLIIALIVFYEIHRENSLRKKLQDLAWKKFRDHVEHLRLNANEIYLLSDIAKDMQDPYSLVKSPHVFETTLENYYKNEKIFSMSDEKLKSIRELRRSIGFLPLSREIAFTSTRQFGTGDKCLIQIPETEPASHKGMCTILGVGEKYWSIDRLDGPVIPEGNIASISFVRQGDAEYTFKTQVINDNGSELVLAHSSKLNRVQQRNWVRVDVSLPVEVAQMERGHLGDVFTAKIIDMSGGGFGMALPTKLPTGAILKLNFELPGHGAITDVMVKVVRVAGSFRKDPTKFVHSVAFEGSPSDAELMKIQEQVTQYVFEVQRQEAKAKLS